MMCFQLLRCDIELVIFLLKLVLKTTKKIITITTKQDALELRLQPAPTFTATSCPHCDNVFEVEIDFEEIKDNVEFERLKKKELETQKEAYKQEITKFQEEVNSLKETLANLCNQLAQSQVENLRSKQASLEQDGYIKQLRDHMKQSEDELHHLAHDFEIALERNTELQNSHMRNTGQLPTHHYSSQTAKKILNGDTSVGPSLPDASTPAANRITQIAQTYGGQPTKSGVAAVPVPQQPSRSTEKQEKYRQQLIDFYSIHNPSKVSSVDQILREFAGHEEDMMVMLARKYCTAPIPTGGQRESPGFVSPPEDDFQLRQVAPWTLQVANSKRVHSNLRNPGFD